MESMALYFIAFCTGVCLCITYSSWRSRTEVRKVRRGTVDKSRQERECRVVVYLTDGRVVYSSTRLRCVQHTQRLLSRMARGLWGITMGFKTTPEDTRRHYIPLKSIVSAELHVAPEGEHLTPTRGMASGTTIKS